MKDLIGSKFGKLTVVRLSRTVHRTVNGKPIGYIRYYLCKCDCGGSIIIRGSHLTYDKTAHVTRSCGCERLKFQHGEKWRAKSVKLGTAFRRCLDQYRANARSRKLSWELTEEQFRNITTSPCHYTGEEPATVQKAKSGEEYIHNGIDRVDNSKGYSIENCVPCSPVINRMKADLPLDRFLELCRKVSERITS